MTSLDEKIAAEKGHVRITALKAVQMRNTGQTLVKVETDAGIVGIGEAGGTGPVTRANLRYMEDLLLGQDPLEIGRLYDTMMNIQHPNRSHVPTVSGVDIALWDIAGKILNRPVSKLLRGQYRTEIPLYTNSNGPANWLDKGAVREWAAEIEAHPYGWQTLKMGFLIPPHYCGVLKRDFRQEAKRYPTLMPSELRMIRKGYENLREALNPTIDMIVHINNAFDLPSAIGLAQAVAPIMPLWLEDPLPVPYHDSWKVLKAASPVPISTGEKLEAPREFLPFLANGVVDLIQPDIVFAGGFTGCWRIAELAEMYDIPVTMHNAGGVVHNVITAHYGATTRNFVMSESALGMYPVVIEEIINEKLEVAHGKLRVPNGPGLGITLNEDAVRANRMPGEPYWA